MSEEQPADMLARLGSNGLLWAQEFNRTAVRIGYSEMDEGWLIGWFANAIENSCNPLRNECDALRAELAAANERSKANYERWVMDGEKLEAERDTLRAELAAERDHHADALEMNNLLQKDKAELRAALAAVSKERDIAWRDKLELMHERDTLRALLKEARSYVQGKYAADSELAFIIDAVLNKGGGDE